jgi:hypothetical protein
MVWITWTHLSDSITNVMNNARHVNLNILNVPKVREEWTKFWFCFCFSTNKAYALDLYLVYISRTHFKSSVGESIFQIHHHTSIWEEGVEAQGDIRTHSPKYGQPFIKQAMKGETVLLIGLKTMNPRRR